MKWQFYFKIDCKCLKLARISPNLKNKSGILKRINIVFLLMLCAFASCLHAQDSLQKDSLRNEKIFLSSTLQGAKEEFLGGKKIYTAFKGQQIVYRVRLEIAKDFFESIHTLHISRFWLEFAKVYEVERIEGEPQENIVYEVSHVFYPTQSGNFEIEPLSVDLVSIEVLENSSNEEQELFGNGKDTSKMRKTTLLTPRFTLKVQDSENPALLYGESKLEAFLQEDSYQTSTINTERESTTPTTYKVVLESYGDVFELDFSLTIPNVSIYAGTLELHSVRKENGLYWHTLSKEFSILAKDSYEIPSFSAEYEEYNTRYLLTTAPFAVHIKQDLARTHTPKKAQNLLPFTFLALILFMVFLIFMRKKHFLGESILRAHSYKELLEILLAHKYKNKDSQNASIQRFIALIEEKIYQNKSTHYDKKTLLKEAKKILKTH